MTIRERIGLVTLTLAAAFVGGAVSGHMFAASAVGAASAPKMITAQKFMLVDANGKTRGVFGITSRASRKSLSSTAVAPSAPDSASPPTADPRSASSAPTARPAPKSESTAPYPASSSPIQPAPPRPPSVSLATASPASP